MASRKSSAAQYTKPQLREKLKQQIIEGDKGGKPGQWSARKAQLLAHEYESHGGGYRGGRKEPQRHLQKWTSEHWQTSDGKKAARPGGTTRYLPRKAWDELSADEKKATNAKKRSGSRHGRQFVANTAAAKSAGRAARKAQ